MLDRYGIDAGIPIITQIGRFDPWRGIDRTTTTFRLAGKDRKCQHMVAFGLAGDNPERERVLAKIPKDIRGEPDIHVFNLWLDDRLENYHEVISLQRAASIIMPPSTREGFGLVITGGVMERQTGNSRR